MKKRKTIKHYALESAKPLPLPGPFTNTTYLRTLQAHVLKSHKHEESCSYLNIQIRNKSSVNTS